MGHIATNATEKTRLARLGRSTAKSKGRVSQPSVETVLDQWRAARPELDLGPLGLFAALAHAYWLTAPEIERLMDADRAGQLPMLHGSILADVSPVHTPAQPR